MLGLLESEFIGGVRQPRGEDAGMPAEPRWHGRTRGGQGRAADGRPPGDGTLVKARCMAQYWPVVAVIKHTISPHGVIEEMI